MPGPIGAAVVVPGFMGSRLARSADGQLVWVEPGWVLAHLDESLDLLTVGGPDDDRLVEDGILEDIDVGPFHPTVYRRLLKFLSDGDGGLGIPKVHVHLFGFDWRRSIVPAATRLAQVIRDAALVIPADRSVLLIAHSQGGLVASKALGEPGVADRIGCMATIGVPFSGLVKVLDTLERGAGLAEEPFGAVRLRPVVASMPGAYELLPRRPADRLFFGLDGTPSTPFDAADDLPGLYRRDLLAAAEGAVADLPLSTDLDVLCVTGYGVDTATGAHLTAGGVAISRSWLGDGTTPTRSGITLSGPRLCQCPVPFGSHVALAQHDRTLSYLRDWHVDGAVGAIALAAVRHKVLPPGMDNLLLVEARNVDGSPITVTAPPEVRASRPLRIQLAPCPVEGPVRWVGPFEHPSRPVQLHVEIPGLARDAQPRPVLLAPVS